MKVITKNSIVGVYPHKGTRCYKTITGKFLPVASVILVDQKIGFSKTQFYGKIKKSEDGIDRIYIEKDTVVPEYDSGKTYQHKIPAGSTLLVTYYGSPAMASQAGVILP